MRGSWLTTPYSSVGIVVRVFGHGAGSARQLHRAQILDGVAQDLQRVGVVVGQVVGHAADARVHVAAAQFLGRHLFAGGRLDQRRPAQEDRALLLDDDHFVAHRRHVGAAGGARSEHRAQLRDAQGAHPRLVVEDAPEVLAVGEHLGLQRQEGAAGVHQVDAGQAVLAGDLLRAQVLLDGQRVVGAALDRGVVGHDHHLAAVHPADAGHQPGGRRLIVVQAVRRQRREFQERRARIQQRLDAVAHHHLVLVEMTGAGTRAAALGHLRVQGGKVGGVLPVDAVVLAKDRVARAQPAGDSLHVPSGSGLRPALFQLPGLSSCLPSPAPPSSACRWP